jgi:DNA polymerase (family 10)
MDTDLENGEKVAAKLIETLRPFCDRMAVVGSIRRKRRRVNNVDVLVTPHNQGQLAVALQGLGKMIKQSKGLYSCWFEGHEAHVWVTFPDAWVTSLLIRTGSEAHNERMYRLAEKQGLKLHRDGSGITREADGGKFEVKTEQDIFSALETPYLEPKDREATVRASAKKKA